MAKVGDIKVTFTGDEIQTIHTLTYQVFADRVTKLEDENIRLRKELDRVIEVRDGLYGDLGRASEDLDELEANLQRFHQTIDERDKFIVSQDERLHGLSAEKNKLIDGLEAIRQARDEAIRRKDEVHFQQFETITELRTELAVVNDRNSALEFQHERDKEFQVSQAELIGKAQNDLEELRAELEAVSTLRDFWREHSSKHAAEIDHLKQEMAADYEMYGDPNDWAERVQELEVELQLAREDRDEAREQRDDWACRWESVLEELERAKHRNGNSERYWEDRYHSLLESVSGPSRDIDPHTPDYVPPTSLSTQDIEYANRIGELEGALEAAAMALHMEHFLNHTFGSFKECPMYVCERHAKLLNPEEQND